MPRTATWTDPESDNRSTARRFEVEEAGAKIRHDIRPARVCRGAGLKQCFNSIFGRYPVTTAIWLLAPQTIALIDRTAQVAMLPHFLCRSDLILRLSLNVSHGTPDSISCVNRRHVGRYLSQTDVLVHFTAILELYPGYCP